MKLMLAAFASALLLALGSVSALSAEIKVLTAGAYKQVLLALLPDFEKSTGHKVTVDNGTVGQLLKRIDGGEEFDIVVVSPSAIDDLAKRGKVAGASKTILARVGIGVMVKEGAPRPDISSVDGFKKALLAAKSVAYIDPKAGGSSGVYLAGLFERLGIAGAVNAKAKLIPGGLVAAHVASGEAELGIHQISEILPVKGVTLVGPLPPDIQNYTVYAAALGANSKVAQPAAALIKALAGPPSEPVLKSKGMAPNS